MAYANIRKYDLRYSDFDFKDELKLSALLELVQESAGQSADELGFGYHPLKEMGYGFIVTVNHCEFVRPVVLGDSLTVETWPLPPRHVIFERDYRLTDGKGEPVGAIVSRWCLVDLASFRMLTPDALGEIHARCPYRAEKALEPANWRLPALTEGREVYRMTAHQSHLDHYIHVNNARYADFFLDCFTEKELMERTVRAFRIVYVRQAKEGAELSFWRKDGEGGTLCEMREGDEVVARFGIAFAPRG